MYIYAIKDKDAWLLYFKEDNNLYYFGCVYNPPKECIAEIQIKLRAIDMYDTIYIIEYIKKEN